MQIEVVSEYDDLMALESIWKKILRQSRNDIMCLTHEWFRHWWSSFGEGKKLFILLVKEKDEVIGIAPFYLTRGLYRNVVRTSEIRFCVNGISPRIDFISVKNRKEVVIQFMLNYLFDKYRLWDILRLNKIHTKSLTYKILKNILCEKKLPFRITESIKSPYIDMDGKWDAYYAGRSSKFRKGMRNKLNRVKRFGDVVIEKIEEEKHLNESLSTIYDISGKSWKNDIGRSLPKNKNQVTFYNHITKSMGKNGWINIWLLKYQNSYIAFEYHLVYKGIVCPIRADFDEEYRDISPGSFLEYNIIKTAFHNPSIREYDFCGDNYKYMLNWTRSVKEYVNFTVFNSRLVSKSLGWTECNLVPLVKKGIGMFAHKNTEGKLCRRR